MDTDKIKSIFGKNVKYYRFHRKLSQSELAEKADISVTFLSNIERGKMFPKVETLSRITESLNVDVSELFKTEIVAPDHKKTMTRFSKDVKDALVSSLDNITAQYLG